MREEAKDRTHQFEEIIVTKPPSSPPLFRSKVLTNVVMIRISFHYYVVSSVLTVVMHTQLKRGIGQWLRNLRNGV